MEDSVSESRFGPDTGFDEEETSVSSDVRSGYDDDQPSPRVVEETSEDDVDSHAADIAAGYEDELEDDDDQPSPRVVEETSEDDVDSHAADIAAGYEDELEDDDDNKTLA
jgi:hypothetical protein